MGEYARYRGNDIKIGTCEDMYYLRHQDRASVLPQSGNVDPVTDVHALRFRFPWPEEDALEPGGYDSAYKVVRVPHGFQLSDESRTFDHYMIQFSAPAGYLVSLPCPEGPPAAHGLTIHRNGFAGALFLIAQKDVDGVGVVPILRCACGAMMRLENTHDIEALAVAFRSEAHTGQGRAADWCQLVADRLLAGLGSVPDDLPVLSGLA